jgi:hypothetical protein
MASKPIQPSSSNPQQMFQSALAAVQGGRRQRQRHSPIARRNVPIAPVQSEQQIEKRAITDAARALAQLWNVSPHLVR